MEKKKCKVDGCKRKYHGKGYCSMHLHRVKRNGDPSIVTVEMHGMKNTSEYVSWIGMKARCYNTKLSVYKRYGGRGIIVCDRWKNSFTAFYEDMGPKPFKGAHVDRIENNGNYEKSNCEWVTFTHNNRHTSGTKLTMRKAQEIRELNATGQYTYLILSKIYGVCERNIRHVINFETWNPEKK